MGSATADLRDERATIAAVGRLGPSSVGSARRALRGRRWVGPTAGDGPLHEIPPRAGPRRSHSMACRCSCDARRSCARCSSALPAAEVAARVDRDRDERARERPGADLFATQRLCRREGRGGRTRPRDGGVLRAARDQGQLDGPGPSQRHVRPSRGGMPRPPRTSSTKQPWPRGPPAESIADAALFLLSDEARISPDNASRRRWVERHQPPGTSGRGSPSGAASCLDTP